MRGILLNIFIGSLISFGVSAHDKREKFEIIAAIREADFIVLATVKDVSYAASVGDSDKAENLPHTFVSFQIQKTLKGNPLQASEITLRFLGGRGEQSSFLHPSNYPLFDIGDQDVLFIKGNTISSCPLYHCDIGRFRVIKGYVYGDRGQQAVHTPNNGVDFGKFQLLPDVMTHKVSETTLYLKEGPLSSEGPPERSLPIGSHFRLGSFAGLIEEKVKALFPPDVLDKWPMIPYADPHIPFVVKPVREVKMKARSEIPYRPIVPPSERDRFEESIFERNQGNPVIKI